MSNLDKASRESTFLDLDNEHVRTVAEAIGAIAASAADNAIDELSGGALNRGFGAYRWTYVESVS